MLKAEYAPRDTPSEPPEADKLIQRRGRVFRQLSDFAAREFKKKPVMAKKGKVGQENSETGRDRGNEGGERRLAGEPELRASGAILHWQGVGPGIWIRSSL